MTYTFDFDYPPGELVCNFWKLDFTPAIEIYKKAANGEMSYTEFSNSISRFADDLVFTSIPVAGQIRLENDLLNFAVGQNQSVPEWLESYKTRFLEISNYWLLQDKVEEMLLRYKQGDLDFLSEDRYQNFFQLPLIYSADRKSYIVSQHATVQAILGLDILNIINKKYRILSCSECGNYYVVKGNYKSAACKNCRGKYAQKKYNESVAADPIKATYNKYYQRYRKRRNSGKLSPDEFFNWCNTASEMRNLYQNIPLFLS